MKKVILAALSIAFIVSGSALADPLQLTNSQMDGITAGFGANNDSTPGEKFDGINDIHHLDIADDAIQGNPSGDNPAIGALGGVGVPSTVPLSISCGAPFACAFD